MKKIQPSYLLRMLLLCWFCLVGSHLRSQCVHLPITHESGTQTIGCTDVTVTSSGWASWWTLPQCDISPFQLMNVFPPVTSSFTFSFSNPISEAKVGVMGLTNDPTGSEELSLEINGGAYSFPGVGTPACNQDPLVLTPSGTLMAPAGSTFGAGRDIIITENMTSITVQCNPISGAPGGVIFSLAICCSCETDAGEITAAPLLLCHSDLAVVPSPEQIVLDADDLLEYILFTDPADTLGSVIATSILPEFAFDAATMSYGTTYYISAIAGNDLGGSVDLADPCLDITTNAVEAIWQPEPTVAFTASVTDICTNDCYDIEINFTGTPPFDLQGEVSDASGVILTFNETYQTSMGIYTLCLPANAELGGITIEATDLSDENCSCE